MEEFAALIEALWSDLGLGLPQPTRGSARMTIDGRPVRFALSHDEEKVVVSTDIGPLAHDPRRETHQLQALLRDGAGMVLGCPAALRLRTASEGKGEAVAVIEAVSPCRAGAVAALRRAVEDVLLLADVHRPTIEDGAPAAGALAALPADHHLVFRL